MREQCDHIVRLGQELSVYILGQRQRNGAEWKGKGKGSPGARWVHTAFRRLSPVFLFFPVFFFVEKTKFDIFGDERRKQR